MENIEKIIDPIRKNIEEYFSSDLSGHNVDHLDRVMKNALKIQVMEKKGDREVIAVSAFVHDVHRIMSSAEGRFISPKESLEVVAKLIEPTPLSKEQKQHVLYAVEHHEEYAFGEGVMVSDIESLILQDADNLDAIGAIGLVRTLKFGISKGLPVFDPTVPLYRNNFTEDKVDISTIHHIYNKLLRLGENMNTKSARKMAKKRTKLMEEFLKQYLEEIA